jgi:aryl-alcohol dehydrogenase-like predicted oxidoreductase
MSIGIPGGGAPDRPQQCAGGVLMVRPAAFGYNPETALTNRMQRPGAADTGQAQAAAEFAALVGGPEAYAADLAETGATTAQAALRWVIQQPGVTTVIPGARTPAQATQNAAAADLPPLSDTTLARISDLYDKYFRAQVHDRW